MKHKRRIVKSKHKRYSKRRKSSRKHSKRRQSVSKRRTKKRTSKRSFGYTHDLGPRVYGVHMDDGMLLANNAFTDSSNPLVRAMGAA